VKVRVDHLLLGIGAFVLLIGSLLAWRALRPDPEQVELDRGLERLRDKPRANSKEPPRFIRPRGAFSESADRQDQREGWSDSETSRAGDPNELGPEQAVDNFKDVLAELETAVENGGRLSELDQAELYNRATGSFTALSTWVDANDPSERALLDDAYSQMMGLMRQLDLEPPPNDPDRSTLRR
jgi:hypothetical protein